MGQSVSAETGYRPSNIAISKVVVIGLRSFRLRPTEQALV